jgi:hypothetical protein
MCAYHGIAGPISGAGKPSFLEIKSIEHIPPVHEAQLPADLRLSSCAAGLLLNPNTTLLKDGIRCFANGPVW